MKIILLVGKFPQLSETFIIRKASGLAQAGHEVLVMSRRRGDKNIWKSFTKNFKVEYLAVEAGPISITDLSWTLYRLLFYSLLFPFRAYKLFQSCSNEGSLKLGFKKYIKYLPFINKNKFDILHAEFLGLGVSYFFLKSFMGINYVTSCRGSDLHLVKISSEEKRENYALTIKSCDMVHCVSDEMRECVHQLTARTQNVIVNRPAVDEASLAYRIETINQIPQLISIGRLEWIKGFDYLLKSYAILKERGLSFQALIIGGGSLYKELKFSIEDLNIQDRVKLTGPVYHNEIKKIIRQADIFVLSSVDEGISNAVLEAMAQEIAVVSTMCGGMPEVISSGVDGLLVPARDPFAMADAITYFLHSPGMRKTMGKNAKNKIEQDFTIARQIQVFENSYKNLLS